MGFTHLHAASAYSAHYGVSWPEELVQAASPTAQTPWPSPTATASTEASNTSKPASRTESTPSSAWTWQPLNPHPNQTPAHPRATAHLGTDHHPRQGPQQRGRIQGTLPAGLRQPTNRQRLRVYSKEHLGITPEELATHALDDTGEPGTHHPARTKLRRRTGNPTPQLQPSPKPRTHMALTAGGASTAHGDRDPPEQPRRTPQHRTRHPHAPLRPKHQHHPHPHQRRQIHRTRRSRNRRRPGLRASPQLPRNPQRHPTQRPRLAQDQRTHAPPRHRDRPRGHEPTYGGNTSTQHRSARRLGTPGPRQRHRMGNTRSARSPHHRHHRRTQPRTRNTRRSRHHQTHPRGEPTTP